MADASDVCNGLVAFLAQTLYPTGTGNASVTGLGYKLYMGWPVAAALDVDLNALAAGTGGCVHVSVFPTNVERNTSAVSSNWQTLTAPAPTLTLTISGQTVTVGGTVSTPQNVVLMVGYKPYVYAVQAADSLTTIATALAALVTGATSSGAVVTLPNSATIQAARVGAAGTAILEVGRQAKRFQIIVWADSPAHRDATVKVIDPALRALRRVTLADTTVAALKYVGTFFDDMVQKANVYRRDLTFEIDFATTQIVTTTSTTQLQSNLNAAIDADGVQQLVATTYE